MRSLLFLAFIAFSPSIAVAQPTSKPTPEDCASLNPPVKEGWPPEIVSDEEGAARMKRALEVAEGFYLYREYTAGDQTINAVGARACEAMFSVLSPGARVFDAFETSPDRQWVVGLSVEKRQFGGANAPLSLSGVKLRAGRISARTPDESAEEPRDIPIEPGDFAYESLSLSISPGGTLKVRLRSVPSEERRYASCELSAPRCVLKFSTTDNGFPAAGYLELTARTAYHVETVPAGFLRQGKLGAAVFVPRTFHLSPDRKWASYLVEVKPATASSDAVNALRLRELATGRDEKLAEGPSFFHARWMDASTLEYELAPAPNPRFAQLIAKERKKPEFLAAQAEVKAMKGEDRELKQALLDEAAESKAAVVAKEQLGMGVPELYEARIVRVRVGPKLKKEFVHEPVLRLWSLGEGPSHHPQSPAREVPPL